MHTPTRSRSGFTLIEMLAVLAVLGVVASIYYPNVGKRFRRVFWRDADPFCERSIDLAKSTAVRLTAGRLMQFEVLATYLEAEFFPIVYCSQSSRVAHCSGLGSPECRSRFTYLMTKCRETIPNQPRPNAWMGPDDQVKWALRFEECVAPILLGERKSVWNRKSKMCEKMETYLTKPNAKDQAQVCVFPNE